MTAFTCVFAYVWLVIVLMGISPNVVEVWEAVLTFVFFPVLIIIAYVADKDFCAGKGKKQGQNLVGIPMSKSHFM